jgi:hypothetical protein
VYVFETECVQVCIFEKGAYSSVCIKGYVFKSALVQLSSETGTSAVV